MKLIDWMKRESLDDDAVAERVGDVTGSAVKKWKYGERLPRRDELLKLYEISGGVVTPNSFVLDPEQESAAESNIISTPFSSCPDLQES